MDQFAFTVSATSSSLTFSTGLANTLAMLNGLLWTRRPVFASPAPRQS